MNEVKPADLLDRTAKIISVIFHPIFIPLYGLTLIFSVPTIYSYLSLPVKNLLFIMVLINNIILPLILISFLKAKKIISSWEMEDRSERMLPLFFATVLYAVTSYIIIKYPTPIFIKTYFISIVFVASVVTVINNWWKISIHSTASGALTALALILSFRMYNVIIFPLIAVVIIAGLMLSSRLRLNSHTPAQVWLGFLVGFIVLGVFYKMV